MDSGIALLLLLVLFFLESGSQAYNVSQQLERLNSNAVKSIQSPDGDHIDCVPLESQPAFEHPLLHKSVLKAEPEYYPGGRSHQQQQPVVQLWQQNGECPTGTVPIRRTSQHDIARVSAMGRIYGKKSHKAGQRKWRKKKKAEEEENPPGAAGELVHHEHAIAYVEGGKYYGARANINIWNPRIQGEDEFSLSQIWILGGSFDGSIGNSIEAGWQVFPGMYGDQRPRLFIYWTSDSYQATGCYNLLCPGFIQTSNEVVIGGAIAPSSSSDGSQYDISILVWKDPKRGNWWLQYGDKLVGYWPAFLFTELAISGGSTVEWGGEVVDTRPNGGHTTTMMGSGLYAEAGFARASYFRDLRVVDESNALQVASGVQTYASNPSCYDIVSGTDKTWGSFFFYGGPGRNAMCR